jgi:hypothetical protein
MSDASGLSTTHTVWEARYQDDYVDSSGTTRPAAVITFPGGAGNTREGQAIIDQARRTAIRAMRHNYLSKGQRVRWVVLANREYGWGALAMLTIGFDIR